ncbi:MAG TPA: 6,7-dimethyl-8-ribityllumazine synthase [Bdellovibrionales bacterium]|nr:6,7-dimethyl-8-ribityllumazine synthase [Bdellovibrionales bacterium]
MSSITKNQGEGQVIGQKGELNGKGLTIGVVTARWNSGITSKLEAGAFATLKELRCDEIRAVSVPGAIEIPVAVKALLESGCHGVVALGCVIRGETTHYEYVCNSVERACTELALATGKPIGHGVLTTENLEQAQERVGGRHGHKGAEAAEVTVEMVRLVQAIRANQIHAKV